MATITAQELRKIAQISKLEINDTELVSFTQQVNEILTYAVRVGEIAKDIDMPSNKNSNVFREDLVRDTDRTVILDQAPEREQDYFVVPMIIQSNK